MTTVYIDRKGIQLDHEPGVAVLRAGGDRLGAVPLAALHRLVLRGVSTVSTRLLAELWTRRISLVVLGGRKSEIVAMMHGPAHRDADIRLCQYALHADEAQRRQRARQLIAAKMKAQLKVLRELAASRPDARHRLLAAIATIDDLAAQLAAEAEPPIDRIMGLEGASTAAHFAALAAVFPPSLGFCGRNRRPPRDPVNACLSLGYTMLHFEAVRASHIAGLDPLIGFFHQPLAGRESLACDLVEPLRPRIDHWVWSLFRDRLLREAHFSTANGACLLGKAGRQHFYASYERWAPPMRRLLSLSCRKLVRDLRSGAGGVEG
jgi:CRISPR-associated protein Cas1